MFLASGEIESLDNRHWKNDNCKVGYNIDCSVGEPQCELVDASRSRLVGPESSHGDAHENVDK